MGAPKSPTVTQTNTVQLSPQQQKIFDLAMPSIQSYAESTPQLFPGTGIVGFNPTELAGQTAALGAAGTGGGLVTQAAGAQNKLLDPAFMLNPNQYVNAAADAVTNKTTQNLMERILPGVRSGATMAGGQYTGGASRQGIAEGTAIRGTNEAISNALADMYFRNYTTGLSGMTQAVAQNPSVVSSQLFPANVMSAVGGQNRALEQARLDEEIRRFYGTQDLELSKAQQLINLVAGMPGGKGVSTATGAVPPTNPLMQGLGLGLSGLGMFGGMPGLGMGLGK